MDRANIIRTGVAIMAATLVAATTNCGRLKLYDFDRGEVVASVDGHNLYASEVTPMIEPGLSPEDSVARLSVIVDAWVRNQIKLKAAETALKGQEKELQDIDERVDDYRNSLLTYRYEQQWLYGRLDTLVTPEQISAYYSDHRDEFRLTAPIVKARIVRIPAGLRQNNRLSEIFRSDNPEDRANFLNICQKNNYRYDDFSNEWADFSTVVQHIPFSQSNFDEFLRNRRAYEVEDDQWKYMMAIDAYRPTGDYSPPERESNNIRKIIINQRRQALLTQLSDSLFSTATRDHSFTVNIRDRFD